MTESLVPLEEIPQDLIREAVHIQETTTDWQMLERLFDADANTIFNELDDFLETYRNTFEEPEDYERAHEARENAFLRKLEWWHAERANPGVYPNVYGVGTGEHGNGAAGRYTTMMLNGFYEPQTSGLPFLYPAGQPGPIAPPAGDAQPGEFICQSQENKALTSIGSHHSSVHPSGGGSQHGKLPLILPSELLELNDTGSRHSSTHSSRRGSRARKLSDKIWIAVNAKRCRITSSISSSR